MKRKHFDIDPLVRIRRSTQAWLYRLRRSSNYFVLMDSNFQGWRHHVGNRVGNYDILWSAAISAATLDELQDLQEIRWQDHQDRQDRL